LRCGTGVSVSLKRDRDEDRVRGLSAAEGRRKVGRKGMREEQRSRWEAALDLYLTWGSRSLSFDAAAWPTALERPEDRRLRFPDLEPRFPVAESPTSIIL
jgi:hypothetical protein